ncbi:hypothetical protein [Deinococcus multiflagellatus]|uniref:Uncharacterized protein n=1 Tax=Deinococcus multiflagellatus TaxID=1656887 RepID=A0ABW1ZSQ9_9DEIO
MTQANLQKRPPGLLDTLEQKAEDLADSVLAALGWGQPRAASPQPGALGAVRPGQGTSGTTTAS